MCAGSGWGGSGGIHTYDSMSKCGLHALLSHPTLNELLGFS